MEFLRQSTEKLLKSILSYHEYHVTRTHSLTVLLDTIIENNIKILAGVEVLIPLSALQLRVGTL